VANEKDRTAAGAGKMGNLYRILVAKPERKRQLGRCRDPWEDNIVACRAVTTRRPRDRRIYQRRF
jgi:hypothetical protein